MNTFKPPSITDSLIRAGVELYVRAQRTLDQNYVTQTWNGHEFRFGYWDWLTYVRSRKMVDGESGIIEHEGVPLWWFNLSDRFEAAIDIGAYHGAYTVVLGVLNPSLDVYAFEPEPYNARITELNCRLNGFSGDRVRVRRAVVSDESGNKTLWVGNDGAGVNHTLNPTANHEGHEEQSVAAVRAAEFCAEHNISRPWVKIDAEGEEFKILEDLLIADHIDSVSGFVELHLDRDGISKERLSVIAETHALELTEVKQTFVDTNPGYMFKQAR